VHLGAFGHHKNVAVFIGMKRVKISINPLDQPAEPPEMAALLGWNPQNLRRLILLGKVPFVRISQRKLILWRREVFAALGRPKKLVSRND
jgi:hypothetical protein